VFFSEHSVVFDELANEQAVMHYSFTASVGGLQSHTRQQMTYGLALLAHLVGSLKTKSYQFSSVQLRRSLRAFNCRNSAKNTLRGRP